MQFDQLKRRDFIALLGSAAAWPLAARAQSADNVRRVGILWPGASPPASPRLESFREGLREAGFIEGENLVTSCAIPRQDFNISRSLLPSSCV
jgi:putative ABC transport system substrate-binding protein